MTARGRTVKVFTEKIESGESQRVPDEVIVEEPISIRLDGELIGTTMRTPGNDFELAAGFCLTEGLLNKAKIKEDFEIDIPYWKESLKECINKLKE